MKDLIFELCETYGVSGDETSVINVAKKHLEKYATVELDGNNNLIATFGNKSSNRHIMLDAHIDAIGLIVKYIDDKGFIFYDTCGGIDAKALSGSVVKILGKEEILGVIGITPPHLMKGKDVKTLPAANELFIDTGIEAERLKQLVSIGDRVAFANSPKQLIGSKITSPALDDRVGVAALIECVRLLSNEKLNCKVSIALTSTEETTGSGAITAAYNLDPDEAIVVDVSFAESEGVPKSKSVPLGSGTMIGVAPILSQKMKSSLQQLAEENNVPYTLEAMGGRTGTNTDGINVSRGGVQSAMLSIPLKYMHTPVEIVDIKDVEATAHLLALYVNKCSEVVK